MTHDYNIGNGSGLDVRIDLNNVLSAILSQNSSATEPTITMAGMLWYDTANSLLKQRNNANDAWLTKWDTTKGQLATLASPTFTGAVNLPSTTYLNGKAIAILNAPTFTGTASFADITASGTISLPTATSIGNVSSTELSYLDGVTSAIQNQLNAKQATLVSGTSIKTINGTTLLGSGDLAIQADSLSTIFANSQTFTASGTFTVPAGVTKVMVLGCSGGGGGGGVGGSGGAYAAGGGGGTEAVMSLHSVTPSSNISVVVGAGGAGGAWGNGSYGGTGSAGGLSSFNGSPCGYGGLGGYGGTSSNADAGGIGMYGINGGSSDSADPLVGSGRNNSKYTGGSYVAHPYGGYNGGGGAGGFGNGANGGAYASDNTGAGGGGGGGGGGSGKVIVYW